MSERFYVTTPIYYINDRPHLGSAYTTVAADALARFHRLHGERTMFVTGTDENSQKNVEAAGDRDITVYLDEMARIWEKTWKQLGISFDVFIRTTEANHHVAVERFWKAVDASGDLYKQAYARSYCVGCEDFKTDSELSDGHCPLHPNKPLERIEEENYFFRATAYKDDLLKLYHQQSDFIQPVSRLNEVRSYVKRAFADFSVSREAKAGACGIPVPGDASQQIYVWFDALINYLSAIGYGWDDKLFLKWWPADLHLVGKDIIKFHCALWPAMLMSAAKSDPLLAESDGSAKLPRRVFAHGFFTVDGQKMSKSLGNAVDPIELAKAYPFDAIRYFFFREIPFGADGDFSQDRLAQRYQGDLGNTLGNLLHRTVSMSRKYFEEGVPMVDSADCASAWAETGWKGTDALEGLWQSVEQYMQAARPDLALEAIWNDSQWSLAAANRFIEETKPFKLFKEDPEQVANVLYILLESLRQFAWMLDAIMPETSVKMLTVLGQDEKQERQNGLKKLRMWGGLQPGSSLPEPLALFPRLETED